MRDPKRIDEVCDLLKKVWARPGWNDLRLGQIICNMTYELTHDVDSFYIEDDKVIDYLKKKLGENVCDE